MPTVMMLFRWDTSVQARRRVASFVGVLDEYIRH